MTFDFAKQQAKKNARSRIVRAVLVIAILVALKIFVFDGSILNVFGPYAAFDSAGELEGLYNSEKLHVTAQAEVFFDTDYVLREDGKAKWYFYAFWAGDQYVICRTPLKYTQADYENFTVQGKLMEYSGTYRQVRSSVVDDIADAWEASRAEADAAVAPYIIYLEHGRLMDQVILGAGALVIVLMLVYAIRGLLGAANPGSTKSYRDMAKKTGYDPAYMNEQLSEEIAGGRVLFENKQLVVTDRWVGEKRAAGFGIYPKADVVWVYRTVTQHRTNGIPSGKSHSVNLCTVHRQSIAITAKNEKAAVQLMQDLQACGFAAIFAFSPELQQLYGGSMEQFVALARGQQAAQAQAPAAAPPPPAAEATGSNDYKGPEF